MAKFSITFILSHIVKDHGGTISIKYRYLLPDGNSKKGKVVFPIIFMKDDTNQMHIDNENPITGKYKGHIGTYFKEPVIFGPDGTVRKKK